MSINIIGETKQIHRLCSNIYHYRNRCNGVDVDINYEVVFPLEYTVKSKYYNADIQLHANVASEKQENNKFEGVIILGNNEVNDGIPSPIPELSSTNPSSDALKLYIVERNADGENIHRAKHIEWSLENGYEFIEVEVISEAPTEEKNQENEDSGRTVTKSLYSIDDWDSREKDGFPRVLEAFENIMWSTMVRNVPQNMGNCANIGEKEQLHGESTNKQKSGNKDIEHSKSVSSTNADVNKNKIKGSGVSLLQQDEIPMEQLDSIFQRVQAQRQQVISGSVPDDARKANAARMALEMMKLLNMGDDSDESDNDM